MFLSAVALALHAAAQPADSSATKGATPPSAQDSSAPAPGWLSTLQKPLWLTDLSLGVKEAYDNNLLLVSGAGPTKEQDSWVTTVSPKVGFNLAPLLGDQSVFQALALGYAPDFATYHDAPAESYTAHRFAATIKGKQEGLSFNLEDAFNYVDGNQEAPTYAPPDNGRSGLATAVPRERRRQFQDRAKIAFQYEQGKWFVRPTAALVYYEMLTERRPNAAATGYQNYPNRNDVNGGLDAGYVISPGLAATLGYRYGHQYQEQLSKAIDPSLQSSPNYYQRALAGLEGKPWKWLTVSLQGGPDFRRYEDTVAGAHVTPVGDKDPVKYYGEATLTADISAKDQATFKYKQWQWLSSTGKLPLFDSLYDLSYRHKFSPQFALDLGFRIIDWDYTSAAGSASKRDDRQYTPSVGLTYNLSAHLSFNVAYAVDLGRNAQDDLAFYGAASKYREFNHHVVSFGGIVKF